MRPILAKACAISSPRSSGKVMSLPCQPPCPASSMRSPIRTAMAKSSVKSGSIIISRSVMLRSLSHICCCFGEQKETSRRSYRPPAGKLAGCNRPQVGQRHNGVDPRVQQALVGDVGYRREAFAYPGSGFIVDGVTEDALVACDQRRSEEHTSELQSRFDLVCRL